LDNFFFSKFQVLTPKNLIGEIFLPIFKNFLKTCHQLTLIFFFWRWFKITTGTRVFFIGEFSQKFDLKNMISSNTKDFSWKNGPNSPNFEKKKIQIAKFLQ